MPRERKVGRDSWEGVHLEALSETQRQWSDCVNVVPVSRELAPSCHHSRSEARLCRGKMGLPRREGRVHDDPPCQEKECLCTEFLELEAV